MHKGISSVELRFERASLYEFILTLVLIFGGGALVLRILFMPDLGADSKSKRNKYDDI